MQVWCNGKLVGEAKITSLPGQRGHEVHVMPDIPMVMSVEPLDEMAVHKIYMPIEKRSVAVDDIEFMRGVGDVEQIVRRHLHIPTEAKMESDVYRCRRIYTWKVFSVDSDVYEQIFDMDWFEPFETGEVDNEALERAWRAAV